jgi:hypothetical protein
MGPVDVDDVKVQEYKEEEREGRRWRDLEVKPLISFSSGPVSQAVTLLDR